MTDFQLYKELSTLPSEMRKQVEDFIAFLKTRVATKKQTRQRKFGCAKGFFKMHEDFDEPLEDFKEYM